MKGFIFLTFHCRLNPIIIKLVSQFGKYNLDCILYFDAGLDCTRIAILRNVGKNVHATVPKGNMGYDQYTVTDTAAVEPTFLACLLMVNNVPSFSKFFKGSLKPILMLNNAKAFHW